MSFSFYKTINKLLCNVPFAGQYIAFYIVVQKYRRIPEYSRIKIKCVEVTIGKMAQVNVILI